MIAAVGAGLMLLELFCAALAYETIGEITSWLIAFFVLVVNLFIAATLLFHRPKVTLVLLLAFSVLIVPYQLFLGIRLLMLRSEAERIAIYLEDTKLRTGEYPADLSGYTFDSEGNREHLQRYTLDARYGGYIFYWYVGTPNTSHRYSPGGGWGYYPD